MVANVITGPVTNFPGGMTNVRSETTLGDYPARDLSLTHELFEDFNRQSIGTTGTDWLYTKTGSATTVISTDEGSNLLITTTTGASDACFLQWMGGNAGTVAENFCMEATNKFWFKTRLKTDVAALSTLVFGLQITDTTPTSVSDGAYFIKPSTGATVDFITAASSVLTTTSAVATMADNTYQTFGFSYDGDSTIKIFVNDICVGRQGITTMPSHHLALSFGIQNSTGVARTMSVDYIFAAEGRAYP